MPMREHLWRVILPYAGDHDRQVPTLEEIQRLVGERAPEPVPVSDPTWLATFRCQRRSTHSYRRGRVMLAGDAGGMKPASRITPGAAEVSGREASR